MVRRWLPVHACLALAACSAPVAERLPAPGPEPREASALASFAGAFDARAGVLSVWQDRGGVDAGSAPGDGSVANLIPEGPTAVTVANQAASGWNNQSLPGYCATSSTGAIVELTSHYAASTKLTNVFAEITSTTPATSGNACNPSTEAPGYAYLTQDYGAWWYGDVTAGQTRTAPWAFTWSGAISYTFRGRIAGQRVETSASQPYAVSTAQTMMASAGSYVLFVDTTSNRIACVWADGTIHLSDPLSGPITAISGDPQTGYAFAAVGGSDPQIAEVNYWCMAWETPTPTTELGRWVISGLAASGYDAVFGIAGTNHMSFFYTGEFADFYSAFDAGTPVTNPAYGAQGNKVYTYFSTSTPNVLKRFDGGSRGIDTVTISQAACARSTTSLLIVTGPDGAVWFMGDGSPGQICSVTDATTTAEATLAGTLGLAHGTDGNMWADGTAGVSRLWVGASNHNTWLALNGVGGSGATRGGMVSGAGGIWFPTVSGGNTTFTRIIP